LCSVPLSILCSAGLLFMNCSNIWLSWKVFVSHLILKDNSSGYSYLAWQLFCFRAWNTSIHALLAFAVSIERSAVTMINSPL
jgi:hypothetical protein